MGHKLKIKPALPDEAEWEKGIHVRCCGRSSEAHAASKTENFNKKVEGAAASAQLVEWRRAYHPAADLEDIRGKHVLVSYSVDRRRR
jgi:hypothetical protein